jgi:sulfur transfer protein SufE
MEFDYKDLDDSHCGFSLQIMNYGSCLPQKKKKKKKEKEKVKHGSSSLFIGISP